MLTPGYVNYPDSSPRWVPGCGLLPSCPYPPAIPRCPDSIAAMLERRRVQRSSAAICQEPDLLGAISTKVSALLQAVGPATFSTDFSISPTRTVHFRSQMTPCGIPSLQIPRDHRNHFVGRSLYRRWQRYGHRDCLRRATRLCEAILRE